MYHNYECGHGNVYLRPLQHSDIELLRIWRNNPDNTKYLNQIPYITKEMQEKWFAKYLEDKDELTFAIVEDHVLHRIVGSISLYNIEDDSIEVGKIMVGDPAAHSMKVGANATNAAARISKERLGKSSIYLHVFENNIAGVKAYRDAGFKEVEKHIDEKGRSELTMRFSY